MDFPAPIHERCVKQACHYIDEVAASENRYYRLNRISAVKCKESVQQSV